LAPLLCLAVAALGLPVAPAPTVLARTADTPGCPMTGKGADTVPDIYEALTPEQRVGQLFMVGLASGASDSDAALTNDAIQTYHAGNVVLYGSGWSSGSAVRSFAPVATWCSPSSPQIFSQ